MNNRIFRKSPIAAGVAFALGTLTAASAGAQDAGSSENLVLEEVVVTGIRSSLTSSMDRKRDAYGVVDAITAEDIGKFPDTNLAESLQRITGVSIDRSNGEGSQITVRGMGPEFNLVTLNGRSMPTAGSRSFDFLDISTEGVSAVEVYKTGNAAVPSGGIGATVNMITPKPLENPGFRSALSMKAVHETSSSDGDLDEVTPEIAGLYSDTFMDDRLGISLTGAWQERQNREEFALVDEWIQNSPDIANSPNITNNNQRADGFFWSPRNAYNGWSDITRTRTNGQLTVQYQVNDRIRASADYTYSELDFEKDANSYGIFYDNGFQVVDGVVNERGTVTTITGAGGDYANRISRDHTIKENNSIGFNVEWDATDSLTLSLDMHDSSSETTGGGLGSLPGSEANLIIGNTFCDWCGFVPGAGPSTATLATKTASFGPKGVHTWDFTVRDQATGEIIPELRRSDLGSLFAQAFDTDVNNDIQQVQLDGIWENQDSGFIRSVEFGYARTDQEYKSEDAYSGQLPAGFWLTSAVHWDDDFWEFDDTSGLSEFANGGTFPVPYVMTADFDALVDQWEQVGADDCCISDLYWPGWGPEFQDPSGTRGRFWSGPLTNTAIVEEKIDALYLQVNFEQEIAGMWLRGRAGVRYEDAETISRGLEKPATAVVWVGGNEFTYEFADDLSFSDGSGSTEEWLPALDLSLEVVEGVIGRVSYSRTLARPPINALRSTTVFLGNPNVNARDVETGNPDLLPYMSDNFDLSLEWYYAEGSYVSAGYFRKEIDNFLQGTTLQTTFDGIRDPYFGPRAEQARAELAAEGLPVNNNTVFERINVNQGADPLTPIRATADDPLVVFDVATQANAETGTIDGWEFALQHMFGYSGFGVLLNATIVDGDVEADREAVNSQFALVGLSDSANASIFYEDDNWSVRLAYNWRDEFLSGFDAASSPTYVEEYSQLDANVTYKFNDNLDVFAEALNLTEEVIRTYVRYPEQLNRANQYGTRFNIGARYNF